ncbi:MAG: RNA-binding protein [Spirulina sp. SIO3F2]|nr:RNA-binding protein [Spirulina sp. SIO3F2]
MSIRLYVGNLPKDTVDREALQEMFSSHGSDISTKVIKDRKTGKCRGFAFVTVPTDELADQIIEQHNGTNFMDVTLKIEKALPREKSAKGDKEGASNSSRPTNNSGGNKARSGKKRGNSHQNNSNTATQPDPRWAADLAKLKEMLTAQATNS